MALFEKYKKEQVLFSCKIDHLFWPDFFPPVQRVGEVCTAGCSFYVEAHHVCKNHSETSDSQTLVLNR